jgi:glyoxylase-like metal-dependent hydrolase (beta-lactamase superfamily II)
VTYTGTEHWGQSLPIQQSLVGYVTFFFLVVTGLLSGRAILAQEREWGVNRSIEQVSPSVYRWGSDNQYGAYIVGTDAIAVVDGHYCPSGTVQWIKDEIGKRHDIPVKYVILSHDHPDHICNTQVFSDTAIAVGHKNIVPHIIRENRPSMLPAITFEESMELDLGGIKINLLFLGPSHSDNLIQVHVSEEKVLIAIDLAKGKSLFPDYRDMDVNSMLQVLGMYERWPDVEVVLPGHGPVTDQENFKFQRRYVSALRDTVLDHMVAGRSLQEIRDIVTMKEFSDYGGFEQSIDANIVTMWDYLYRYREPNNRITEIEAVECRMDITQCRTSNVEQ